MIQFCDCTKCFISAVFCLFVTIMGDKFLEQRINITFFMELGKIPMTFTKVTPSLWIGNNE
jgi:hypothetical protein